MKPIVFARLSALSVTTLAQAQGTNRTVDARKAEQQQRIAQVSGQAKWQPVTQRVFEHQERAINRDIRAANNGRLTRSDRLTLQHQQNQKSRRMYR